jgi:ABC-type amino acid transport substrate-binding protein
VLTDSTIKIRRALLVVIGLLAMGGVLFAVVLPRLQAQQRWQSLLSRGVLRIGIDPGVARFSFFDDSRWAGFDTDVATEIAGRLNLRVEAVPVGYDGFYDALLTERVDVSMSALVPDDARLNEALFSQPYVDMGVRLIGPERAMYRSPSDLRGRVGVLLGTDADRAARYYERRVAGLSRANMSNAWQAIEGIRVGTLEWVMLDAEEILGRTCRPVEPREGSAHPNDTRCFALQPQPYVMAAARSNARLMDEINRALQAMQADGTLDRIAQKWLSQSQSSFILE